MKTEVIGIDPATHCGFAHSLGSGVWDLSPDTAAPSKGRVSEPEWARCGKLGMELDSMAFTVSLQDCPVVVFCESAQGFTRFPHTLRIGHELRGVIKQYCFYYGWKYVEVPPTTLKKWATGSGKASKGDMIEAANVYANGVVTSDDEADAILLRQYGLDQLKDIG